MTIGITVILAAVFFVGAFSTFCTGIFLVLMDRHVRQETREMTLWQQIKLVLD